jgi:hypothetical protein
MFSSDQGMHDLLAGLVTLGVLAWLLFLLVRWLRRSRPGLLIGGPIALAFGLRILAAIAVTETGSGASLRGGDENFFLLQSHLFAHRSLFGPDWTSALTSKLYEWVFAIQIRFLDSSQLVMRFTQAAIAVAGLALLATAVYQLSGPRGGRIAAWLLALEPSNIFFSTLLHKEPNLLLAGGLVAFGGACMWKSHRLMYLWPMTVGCLIAVATRPYAGWFLIAAAAAITLHVGIKARTEGARSLALVALVILLGAISAPTILKASTHSSLQKNLQNSQSANTNSSANLSLERVDFSTRGAIIANLPQRIADVLSKPYPWQQGNTSQQLGLLGTLFAWTFFVLLLGELWRGRGHVMERAGPFVYIGVFTLIAYSLSAGNAGTAFRYRMHIVALVICLVVVLRVLRTQEETASAPARIPGRQREPRPTLAGV